MFIYIQKYQKSSKTEWQAQYGVKSEFIKWHYSSIFILLKNRQNLLNLCFSLKTNKKLQTHTF